jgi:hypothetical protein
VNTPLYLTGRKLRIRDASRCCPCLCLWVPTSAPFAVLRNSSLRRKALSDFSAQIPSIYSYPPTTIHQSLNGILIRKLNRRFLPAPISLLCTSTSRCSLSSAPKPPYMLKKRNLLVLIGQRSYQLLLGLFCSSMSRCFLRVSREKYSAQAIPQQRLVKL